MKEQKWNVLFFNTIVIVLFLNILYAAFFYEKIYDGFSVTTELKASEKTTVWYVYKDEFSEQRYFSEKKTLQPSQKERFIFDITSKNKIDYIGIFWVAEKGNQIEIDSYSYMVDDKVYESDKNINIIHYTNKGSNVTPKDEGVIVKSSDSNRNWIILNLHSGLNKKRDHKLHLIIPWAINLFLVFGIFLIQILYKTDEKVIVFKKTGFNLKKIRQVLFCFWIFIIPFWIIISHVLLILIVLITIYEYFKEKEFSVFKITLKSNIVFYIFYALILIASLINKSTPSQVLRIATDYSYFLLMPVAFSMLKKETLNAIFNYLEKGLYLYFLLLIVYASVNFYKIKPDYSFLKFLELCLEFFWHTSYISTFIIILFIKKINGRVKLKLPVILFYSVALMFMYLINARIPFIVGGLLLAYKIFMHIKSKNIRIIYAVMMIVFGISMVAFFLYRDVNNNSQHNSGDIQKIDARLSIWEASLSGINDNLFFGVGGRNTIDVIAKEIDTKDNTKYRNYNAHNQFIETFLGYGLFTFISLIVMFLIMFRQPSLYSKMFILSCALMFMVESYLQRQAGVIFFTFWYCFFINYTVENNEHIKD